jgi:hypothetical protein
VDSAKAAKEAKEVKEAKPTKAKPARPKDPAKEGKDTTATETESRRDLKAADPGPSAKPASGSTAGPTLHNVQ